MNERQAVGGVAVATHSRLGDAAAIHLHARAEGAHLALEERLLHLGDELRGADHHAADGDQLIDVCRGNTRYSHTKHGMEYFARAAGDTVWIYTHTFWVQAPHVSGFQGVVGANLDLVLEHRVREALEEKLIDRHVKGWNNFLQRKETICINNF